MRQLGFVILFFFATGLLAQSQVVPSLQPGQKPQTQNSQRPPEADKKFEPAEKGPTQNAAPLNAVVSGKPELSSNKEPDKKEDKNNWLIKNLTGLFTEVKWTDILLAAFTGLLVWVGVRQLNLTYLLEMPIPSVFGTKLVAYVDEAGPMIPPDPVPPGLVPKFCRVLVGVHNAGRTPMRITKFCFEQFIAATIPQQPQYMHFEDWSSPIPPNTGSWAKATTIGDIRLTPAQHHAIQSRQEYLWVFGFFRYSDVRGKSFDVGFLVRWDIGQGFVREPNKNYEYQRES